MDPLYRLADLTSTYLNQVLLAIALIAPPRRGALYLRLLVGTGIAVALAESGKHFQVWPGHPGFPSGHATCAAALSVSLARPRGKLWWLIPALAIPTMAVCLVYGRWHTVDEAIAGSLLGTALALAVGAIKKR